MLKHIILIILTGANFMTAENETIVLGAGCFWCVEAIYERIDGVITVEAGYANGQTENPTYDDVCNGNTGYAEVAKIAFDPQKVSFEEILDIFWKAHDPTTLNRQGGDIGVQYRSGIYFQSGKQKEIAEKSMSIAQDAFKNKIVTEIEPLKNYYIAEDYHQNYYDNNKNAPYCSIVIAPKLKKLNLED